MKKTLFIIAAAIGMLASLNAAAQTELDSLIFVNTDWNWQDIGNGAKAGSAQLTIFDAPQFISIVKYPMKRFKTSIISCPEEKRGATDVIAQQNGARIACNGSYFNMRKLTPVTFFSIDGEVLGETTPGEKFRVTGAVTVSKNGKKVTIEHCDSTLTETLRTKFYAVLASGPILIKNGVTLPTSTNGSFFTSRHPRTIIGVKDGYVYMVDIDGRFKGQAVGATIPETAAVARYLGLKEALNLDGGGSSTVWTDKTGVLNHPNDNGKWDHAGCRKVPNLIIAK